MAYRPGLSEDVRQGAGTVTRVSKAGYKAGRKIAGSVKAARAAGAGAKVASSASAGAGIGAVAGAIGIGLLIFIAIGIWSAIMSFNGIHQIEPTQDPFGVKMEDYFNAAPPAEGFDEITVLGTITKDDCQRVAKIKGEGKINCPQSMAYLGGDTFVIAYSNTSSGDTQQYLKKYKGNREIAKTKMSLGHANGLCYSTEYKMLYSVRGSTTKCVKINAETLERVNTFNLPAGTSGIAYDSVNGKFYLSSGENLRVTDSSFKLENSFKKKGQWKYAQDIGGYNGIIYSCVCLNKNSGNNRINMYDAATGNYCGTYRVTWGEIEDCEVDENGRLLILINDRGSNTDYIYRTTAQLGVRSSSIAAEHANEEGELVLTEESARKDLNNQHIIEIQQMNILANALREERGNLTEQIDKMTNGMTANEKEATLQFMDTSGFINSGAGILDFNGQDEGYWTEDEYDASCMLAAYSISMDNLWGKECSGSIATELDGIDTSTVVGRAKYIYIKLREAGYPHKAACGILGNIEQESNFDPGAVDKVSGSLGLCQWNGGRAQKMKSWVLQKSGSDDWKNLEWQAEYLIYDLTKNYKDASEKLRKRSVDIEGATKVFLKEFEASGNYQREFSVRLINAKKWDELFKDLTLDTVQGGGGTGGRAINNMAWKLAWPLSTPKGKTIYPSGKPTAAFQSVFDKVYPQHRRWGAAPGKGASCDVGAGTVIRAAGVDKDFPRGLAEQGKMSKPGNSLYSQFTQRWDLVYEGTSFPVSKLKPGDVVIESRTGGGHIWLYVEKNGKGYRAEASLGDYFLRINNMKKKANITNKKVKIYRAKGGGGGYVGQTAKACQIGMAVSNEYGGQTGGTPGDNNGKEVVLKDWEDFGYSMVLRPKDRATAKNIASAMSAACYNDNIGYDTLSPLSVIREAENAGYTLANISSRCSCNGESLLQAVVRSAGIDAGSLTSGSLQKKLLKTGQFTKLKDKKYLRSSEKLKQGDILLEPATGKIAIVTAQKGDTTFEDDSNLIFGYMSYENWREDMPAKISEYINSEQHQPLYDVMADRDQNGKIIRYEGVIDKSENYTDTYEDDKKELEQKLIDEKMQRESEDDATDEKQFGKDRKDDPKGNERKDTFKNAQLAGEAHEEEAKINDPAKLVATDYIALTVQKNDVIHYSFECFGVTNEKIIQLYGRDTTGTAAVSGMAKNTLALLHNIGSFDETTRVEMQSPQAEYKIGKDIGTYKIESYCGCNKEECKEKRKKLFGWRRLPQMDGRIAGMTCATGDKKNLPAGSIIYTEDYGLLIVKEKMKKQENTVAIYLGKNHETAMKLKEMVEKNGKSESFNIVTGINQMQAASIGNKMAGGFSTGLFSWPINMRVGRISSNFGYRNVGIGSRNHKGMDIAAPKGTAILAADGGEVVKVVNSDNSARGLYVKIRHAGGYETVYQHNSKNVVSVGQKVAKGQKIAEVGSTGTSSGAHLHFEIQKNGVPMDPRLFLVNR